MSTGVIEILVRLIREQRVPVSAILDMVREQRGVDMILAVPQVHPMAHIILQAPAAQRVSLISVLQGGVLDWLQANIITVASAFHANPGIVQMLLQNDEVRRMVEVDLEP